MKRWPKKGQEAVAPVKPIRAQSTAPSKPIPTKPACTDCGSTTRKLTQVSPKVQLCATDIRERKKAKSLRSRETRQQRNFGISLAEGDRVTAHQGGGCICKPWTGYNGNSRALSTDHDHKTGLIRGKLCKHCNDLLGRVRDDPDFFLVIRDYLLSPPAVQVLGERYVPESGV